MNKKQTPAGELTDAQIEAVLNDSDLNLICYSEVHDKWAIKFARAVIAAHEAHLDYSPA